MLLYGFVFAVAASGIDIWSSSSAGLLCSSLACGRHVGWVIVLVSFEVLVETR